MSRRLCYLYLRVTDPTRVLGEAVYVEKVLKNTAAKRDRVSGIFLFSEGKKRVGYIPILKLLPKT